MGGRNKMRRNSEAVWKKPAFWASSSSEMRVDRMVGEMGGSDLRARRMERNIGRATERLEVEASWMASAVIAERRFALGGLTSVFRMCVVGSTTGFCVFSWEVAMSRAHL